MKFNIKIKKITGINRKKIIRKLLSKLECITKKILLKKCMKKYFKLKK